MKKKSNTMNAVARECGVSVSTVSRVLTNEPGVSVETRRRVLEAVKSCGFTRQSRRRHITRSILRLAVVLPDSHQLEINPFFDPGELLNAINNAFHKEKKSIEMITYSELERASWKGGGDADGFIFAFGEAGEPMEKRLRSGGIPYIFLNRTPEKGNYISCNNFKGMLRLGQYLAARGYRKIGYLGCGGNPVNRDRLRGYTVAMMEQGNPPEKMVHAVPGAGDIDTAAARFFTGRGCDAVMAFNDNFAIRLIQALSGSGVMVPRDMAVTGFDNAPARAVFTPAITTVSLSAYEMGFLAARWLRDNILHRETRGLRLEVEGALIEGDSVGIRRGAYA